MPWIFQRHSNSKANFAKTLNESSWSELAHYLTCSKFKLKMPPNSLPESESNFELCRWIGNFFINILLSLNSVGVTLPTLILFVKDGVGRLRARGDGENICKRGNVIFDGAENDKRIRRDWKQRLCNGGDFEAASRPSCRRLAPACAEPRAPSPRITSRIHFALCLIRGLAVTRSALSCHLI